MGSVIAALVFAAAGWLIAKEARRRWLEIDPDMRSIREWDELQRRTKERRRRALAPRIGNEVSR